MAGRPIAYRNGGSGGPGAMDDEYDPYGDENYRHVNSALDGRYRPPQPPPPPSSSSPARGGGGGGRLFRDDLGNSRPVTPSSRGGGPPPPQPPPPPLSQPQPPPRVAAPTAPAVESDAERQITRVLEHIRAEWPSMLQSDCVPVQLALQLLDGSSVGRARDYKKFGQAHDYLQSSLKSIVHEHHQGFNSSIGTFHKIQDSIQASQRRVRALKDSLSAARVSLCSADPELRKLSAASQAYDDLLQSLAEVEELRLVPDQLEARISEKRFLAAVDLLQGALRRIRRPELDGIGALADLGSYLSSQEGALTDILVEELHEHLYLKSPYCQERWQSLARSRITRGGGAGGSTAAAAAPPPASMANLPIPPFLAVLESLDFDVAPAEDPAKNPESDTFAYVCLLVEALNRLGRLQDAVDTLKQRLPVELFSIASETVHEVDNRHLASLRGEGVGGGGGGGGGGGRAAEWQTIHIYGRRETQLRADVLHDLLWTLYAKFEAIAEGHRVFHESVKALIRREGAGNNSALLGTFRELWNLYQNEIRSLLHNYVTTDADVYHFDMSSTSSVSGGGVGSKGAPDGLSARRDAAREHLFRLAEADSRSPEMTEHLDALEGIIQAAVPGLTTTRNKQNTDKKWSSAMTIGGRDGGARRGTSGSSSAAAAAAAAVAAAAELGRGGGGTHKPLVQASVFNMSLLLPPTLTFLTRLRGIVPPGSDLATSTLTSFLDNFLVNVFQPQLEETLTKLGDQIFAEPDSFLQDQNWARSARRPVLRGATAFFEVVTAFCRMLGTIPHDQALSSLIVSQMQRYHDRYLGWYRSLVSGAAGPEEQEAAPGSGPASATSLRPPSLSSPLSALRLSARLADEGLGGELHEVIRKLWDAPDGDLLSREVGLLIARATASPPLSAGDVIQDRDVISSLCLLYTSMNWIAVKVSGLRHITRQEADSSSSSYPYSRPGHALSQPGRRRWTLTSSDPSGVAAPGAAVLPMTQETVKTFDSIVASYECLALTALLTLHMEARCRIAYSLSVALSPEKTATYLLDRDVSEPDPQVLALNADLVAYDETVTRFLRGQREITFVRAGLGRLVDGYLVTNAPMASPMNGRGCRRMLLNIRVLQQNLKNIEDGTVDLARARGYYTLFERGVDAVIGMAAAGGGGDGRRCEYSYEELKALLELCLSEQLVDPERGIASAAKRQLADKLLSLNEHMWGQGDGVGQAQAHEQAPGQEQVQAEA